MVFTIIRITARTKDIVTHVLHSCRNMSHRESRMASKHIHKYHKIRVAGQHVMACALPDCTHYMPYHIQSILLGKKTYCWNCNEIFLLDEESMKMEKPTCSICRINSMELVTELSKGE